MDPTALLALLALGFGAMELKVGVLERAAAADIASVLRGDGRSVKVQAHPDSLLGFQGHLDFATISASNFEVDGLPLFTEPWRSQKARVGQLRIRLNDFVLSGLHVQELYADIPNCRYDLGLALTQHKFRISRSGVGWGWVKISEEDLADYILRHFKEIESLSVRVFNDVVWIEGTGTFLIAKTNFAVIAKLGPGDGTRLVLEEAKVYFDWIRADPALVEVVLKALNPVIDLSGDLGLLDAIHVQEIRLRDGFVVAAGPAKVPIKLGGGPADNKG